MRGVDTVCAWWVASDDLACQACRCAQAKPTLRPQPTALVLSMGLARSALFNLVGAVVPAVAALLTVPVLVAHLGSVNYGILILVTSIIGYFSILDINVTAGSVKYIAEFKARGDDAGVRQVLSFGALLYLGIGAVGGTLVAVFAGPLAQRVFNIPSASQAEAIAGLRWAGAAFMAGQVQIYLQSVPQALERYDVTGKLESVFGSLASILTMLVALAGGGLLGVVIARLLLSLVNIAALVLLIRRLLPGAGWQRPPADVIRSLGSFSAFSYLNRLASISAANTDKLLIAALVDMRSLAYYSIPFLLVNRVFALAFRLSQVMFPKASALASQGRFSELRRTYLDVLRYIVFVNVSIALLLAALAPELLRYWAGKEFGTQAVLVMVCVVAAVVVDSLTNLPALVNDGLGHPRVTGIGALARAGVGIVASIWAIQAYGILGAALAQLVVSITATVLFAVYVHGRTLPVKLVDALTEGVLPSVPPMMAALALGLVAVQRSVLPFWQFVFAGAVLALGLALYGWGIVLLPPHRARLRARLRPA